MNALTDRSRRAASPLWVAALLGLALPCAAAPQQDAATAEVPAVVAAAAAAAAASAPTVATLDAGASKQLPAADPHITPRRSAPHRQR
jgi:hypothetical protein